MQIGRARFGAARIAWADVHGVDGLDNPAALNDPDASVWARVGVTQFRRFRSLSGTRARDFAAGRMLLASLVDELTDQHAWQITSICERCGGDHGRPQVAGVLVAVSVSYADGMVAVGAVTHDEATSIGVDIERESARGAHDLARLFAPRPAPDLAGWTLIEAALKADGRGVRVPVAEVVVGELGTGTAPSSRAVSIPGRTDRVDAAVLPGPAGFVLSAAVVLAAQPAR